MQFRRDKKTGPTVSLQDSLDTGKDDSALTLSDLLQDSSCMEETFEKKDDAQRLRQLIETLPARERQLFWASAEAMCRALKPMRCSCCGRAGRNRTKRLAARS